MLEAETSNTLMALSIVDGVITVRLASSLAFGNRLFSFGAGVETPVSAKAIIAEEAELVFDLDDGVGHSYLPCDAP